VIRYPAFDPTGQTVEPAKAANGPLLYVTFKPRYSLYLDTEKEAEFIVNAALSPYFGLPLPDSAKPGGSLAFTITPDGTDKPLVRETIAVKDTSKVFKFDLSKLKAGMAAQPLTLTATIQGSSTTYTATSELLFLPDKKNGSVTKIDNLHGGMLFRNAASGGKFEPLLAYGYYSSYDGFLGENDTALIQKYADYGLNGMTPLTQYPQSADAFAFMDKINLKYQYDLREGYKNLTWVEQNVRAARNNEAIYSYWSADEYEYPDPSQEGMPRR